jgi:hypothetical protein
MGENQTTIKALSQKDADCIMKGLSGEALGDFKLGFHDESKSILKGKDHVWALPLPEESAKQTYNPDNRFYYLISFEGIPYLLVGINPTPIDVINLSSFARIVSQPKGKATVCLRKLIEDKLVPMCREKGKRAIFARIATDRGEKVFHRLRRELPKGIKEIEIASPACHVILRE